MALDKYIIEFKLTKYSWWQFSLCLVCHFGRLELTVSTEQFGLLCRQVYMKVSKPANEQVSMKLSGHGSFGYLCLVVCD